MAWTPGVFLDSKCPICVLILAGNAAVVKDLLAKGAGMTARTEESRGGRALTAKSGSVVPVFAAALAAGPPFTQLGIVGRLNLKVAQGSCPSSPMLIDER